MYVQFSLKVQSNVNNNHTLIYIKLLFIQTLSKTYLIYFNCLENFKYQKCLRLLDILQKFHVFDWDGNFYYTQSEEQHVVPGFGLIEHTFKILIIPFNFN